MQRCDGLTTHLSAQEQLGSKGGLCSNSTAVITGHCLMGIAISPGYRHASPPQGVAGWLR